MLLYITTYVIPYQKKNWNCEFGWENVRTFGLDILVVILSSNGYFGNGHPIHNEINRSDIELLKADNAKLWKELEKMTEKVQILTENGHGAYGKCLDKTSKL